MPDVKARATLRLAQIKDAEAIARLGSEIFTTTFGWSMPAVDLATYLEDSYSTSSVGTDIADPNVDFIVAVDSNDQVVGFTELRRGSSEPCVESAELPIELQRLYVSPDYHGKGVARMLFEEVERIAREQGFKTLWLGVWEENFKVFQSEEQDHE